MNFEDTLSVKEFADATGRFPNQIYDLINKGNRFRKLNAIQINGKKRIPKSEVDHFPFTQADQIRIALMDRVTELEERVNTLEVMLLP
jgi:hypothetical protein